MGNVEQAISLAAILNFSPPKVQKVLIEKILKINEISFTPEIIKEYEDYWSQVHKNFKQQFMHKD